MANHTITANGHKPPAISRSLVLSTSLMTSWLLPGVPAWGQCQANELAKLTASGAAAEDQFGFSVSISGDVAVMGARFDHDVGVFSGSAYVFRFDGTNWIEEAELTASDAAAWDEFGFSVSISGNVAVIGAPLHDHAGSNFGSAYVYRFDGTEWIEQTQLTPSDAAAGDIFGWSVSISGDVAVVGAIFGDGNVADSGSAYVYRFDGTNWIEEAELTASDAAWRDAFGFSVSISGNVAVIGAPGNDDAGLDFGSAYVFRFNGAAWVEEQKLTASDAAAGDWFGYSVSISGDVALIGAIQYVNGGPGSAYVYQFDGTNWVEEAKLAASDAAAEHLFGKSVSISGDVAVIGAPGNYDAGTSSGSTYVFGSLSDCNDNSTLDLCDIADGTSKDANGNGIPDECEPRDCPADLDGDGSVGILDLLALLAAWGSDPGGPPDFDGDGTVGIFDLLILLASWGLCL